MKDSLTKSKGDGKQSISNDSVNKQPETVSSDFEDNSAEAVQAREFQAKVDGSEEMQKLSSYKVKIYEDTVAKESTAFQKQQASVNRLSKPKQNKDTDEKTDTKVKESTAFQKQQAFVNRLSKPKQNKDTDEKTDSKVKESTAFQKQQDSVNRLSKPKKDKKEEEEEKKRKKKEELKALAASKKTLSQPNQDIIHAGDREKEESSEQQDLQIAALLADAGKALGPFTEIFQELKKETKAFTDKVDRQKKVKYPEEHRKVLDETDATKEGDVMYKQNMEGPVMLPKKVDASDMGDLKGAKRIKQKMSTKYKAAGKSAVNEINDVVRGTLAFKDFGEILFALDKIKDLANTDFGGFTYQIARVKQIYTPISELLYGDIKFNLNVKSNSSYKGEAFDHNCELQLNTTEMLKGKGRTDGHGAYEQWRDLDDEHWQHEGKELPKRLVEMKPYYKNKATNAIKASHNAYKNAEIQRKNDMESFTAVIKKVEEIGGNIVDTPAEASGGQTLEATATEHNIKYGEFIAENIKEEKEA